MIIKHLTKHKIIYGILLVLMLVFWFINRSIMLPIPGVLYWDYARHLQAGYLDSPYMLPLFIKGYSTLFGYSALAYGYIKFLIFVIIVGMLYIISVGCYDKKIALITVMMFIALPLQHKFFDHLDYHLGVFLMLPFVLFAITGWFKKRSKYYLYLGGIFLGMMLMMQTEAVLYAVSLALASLCVSGYRQLWREPAFYVGLLLALLIVSPFIFWQIQHNWVTIKFLTLSNDTAYSLSGFLAALFRTIGDLGLYFLLLLMVLIRQRGLRSMDDSSKLFCYVWLFSTILLNIFLMHDGLRHEAMIGPNMVLLLFLAPTAYQLYPRLTLIFTALTLLISLVYTPLSMNLMYRQNNLAFEQQIQPLVQDGTLIISHVIPYDGAPSWFSMHLRGQPEVYALPDQPVRYVGVGNPKVYFWQAPLAELFANKKWQQVLVLSDEPTVAAQLQPYIQCSAAQPLTIDTHKAKSVKAWWKTGLQQQHLTIYAHLCQITIAR